jgi:hypothetical protein
MILPIILIFFHIVFKYSNKSINIIKHFSDGVIMEIFVHDLMIKYSKSSWFIVMDEKKKN